MTVHAITTDLTRAGRALAAAGLVNAFGHVSARLADSGTLLITPPQPLGRLQNDDAFHRLSLAGATLPTGVPKEGWIHRAVAIARPDVGGICRAQPFFANAAAVAGVEIRPLHGQGALLGGTVPVFDQPRLVRDPETASALAVALGPAHSLVMRGNGALTVGRTVGEAVARMWVLEEAARLALTAAAAGEAASLTPAEQSAWEESSTELLGRIWEYLAFELAHCPPYVAISPKEHTQ
ncbi:class II aldolase/adducin family protein [Streptomyces sp. KS_5]|uniref:class II aldolase/adducin family protein n=1 Tax=Streptomyces sp. KS_5 TaxID=1881018 RepID=UPI0008968BF7|nr:class II aldolase/adducin family protein [Streptomyces sp. KS_5]SEE35736.1 HCOMODA/2-hydroxy-3-carboxy-muconic semialdehyde decarboxylase [Streptomyces sp. KS_5]